MAWQSLGIFGQVNTQTFHFLKHFLNASLKKRYYRKKKKNCAQIRQESKKKKKKKAACETLE